MTFERIEFENKLYALVVRKGIDGDEPVQFLTAPENPLQVGVFFHRAGAEVKAHVHKQWRRVVEVTQEVVHVDSGRLRIDIYEDVQKVTELILSAGETVLLMAGGHGIVVLEDSHYFEVKQGPYMGVEQDKTLLEDIERLSP